MSSHAVCLNCGTQLTGKFCQECGQSASTHRLSIKHFVMHDIVHGMWHVDRGLLFTLGCLFTRPGDFVHEYIGGKRAGHFNVITLLLLLSGLLLYLSGFTEYSELQAQTQLADISDPVRQAQNKMVFEFWINNFKWILLSLIPIIGLASVLIFRRKKYYYTEHVVLNSYFFAGFLMILALVNGIFTLAISKKYAQDTALDLLICIPFLLIAYWQVWRSDYTVGGWLWRMLCFFIATMLIACIFWGAVLVAFVKYTQ
jgi:hypothetical protein